MTAIAQLDGRKRVSLASYATSDIYLINAEPSGRIVLEPASVVSRLEQAVRDNPSIMAEIRAFNENPEDLIEED